MMRNRFMKWLSSILAVFFFAFAIFGAFGEGIFPFSPTELLLIIIIVLTSLFISNKREVRPSRSFFDEGDPPILRTIGKGLLIGFVLGNILLSIPVIYAIVSNLLIRLWNNLPTIAQLNPYISIILSVVSFILAILNYRLQHRKDERDLEEYLSRKAQRDSKIATPTNDEIVKYTNK